MLHFPVFLDLRGRTVLVLGTGAVAERKAAPARQAGAMIRFAAPSPTICWRVAPWRSAPMRRSPTCRPWPPPAAPVACR